MLTERSTILVAVSNQGRGRSPTPTAARDVSATLANAAPFGGRPGGAADPAPPSEPPLDGLLPDTPLGCRLRITPAATPAAALVAGFAMLARLEVAGGGTAVIDTHDSLEIEEDELSRHHLYLKRNLAPAARSCMRSRR